jgi:UDP-N-acetylglucosamine 2-epimerase
MKVVTIIGARPQFIKAAAVSRALQASNQTLSPGSPRSKRRIQEILVHTGQHYDYLMDKVFFEELKMQRCDYHLGVGSGAHGRQTGVMLQQLEPILQKEKPDVVLVYGDTNSTLAGALAAAKMQLPVAHVEAGLRSYDRNMPEEINRLLTDHVSMLLFCPTEEAVENLAKEGIRNGKQNRWVENVGDVMHDSILFYAQIAEEKSTILKDLGLVAPDASRLTPYCLATLHRAENTDNPERLKSILKALEEISRKYPVILPLHPRTKKMMGVHGLRLKSKTINLIDPVSYLNMLKLEKNAKAILTDSGGVQKEAYWLRVPCVTLREVTEWGYTVEEGWNTVAGWKTAEIVRSVRRLPARKKTRRSRGDQGKQTASEKIAHLLFECVGNRTKRL